LLSPAPAPPQFSPPSLHDALPILYAPCRVFDVPAAVRSLRALGIAGANVTVPHKQAVIASLDRLDPAAERIGAVGCIVNRDGVLHGHNTDREGGLRALGSFSGHAVVLVAGRSARPVLGRFGAGVHAARRTRVLGRPRRGELAPERRKAALACRACASLPPANRTGPRWSASSTGCRRASSSSPSTSSAICSGASSATAVAGGWRSSRRSP